MSKAKVRSDSFWGDLANALVLSPVHRKPIRRPVTYGYVVRDHSGLIAISHTFDSVADALAYMSQERGVQIVDGRFLADGYWVDMVELR